MLKYRAGHYDRMASQPKHTSGFHIEVPSLRTFPRIFLTSFPKIGRCYIFLEAVIIS